MVIALLARRRAACFSGRYPLFPRSPERGSSPCAPTMHHAVAHNRSTPSPVSCLLSVEPFVGETSDAQGGRPRSGGRGESGYLHGKSGSLGCAALRTDADGEMRSFLLTKKPALAIVIALLARSRAACFFRQLSALSASARARKPSMRVADLPDKGLEARRTCPTERCPLPCVG